MDNESYNDQCAKWDKTQGGYDQEKADKMNQKVEWWQRDVSEEKFEILKN